MDSMALISRAETAHELTQSELLQLLQDQHINDALFAAADRVRQKYVGPEVHLRALIEFTNICCNNCLYCGLQSQNRAITRYRMAPQEIFALAQKAVQYGYKTVVLQGGEDPFFTADILVPLLRQIKGLGLAVTLSIGERPRSDYQRFKEAGADRYLLRIETTDPALYEKYHPGMSLANRLRCLQDLKELGYETGTGVLVGLPEQTELSLARDILFFKQLGADMIGLGPFIPNPDTPLKDAPVPRLTPALKVMALARLLLPDINIPATTSMETLEAQGRFKALQSGANVIMPNITGEEERKNYALYPGKNASMPFAKDARRQLEAQLKAAGRPVSAGYGWHHKSR